MEQAILLTGGWGCGKTHFIDKFIEKQAPERLRIIKISLFGLRAISEIEDRILGEFHPIITSKPLKLLGASAKKLTGVLNLDLSGGDNPEISLSANAESLNLFNLLIRGKTDFAIVLDDLERSDIDIQELLGYISYTVEACKIKTILIANESVLEKKHGDRYREFKEKTVCKTFEITHNAELAIDLFLKSDANCIYSLKKTILETYAASDSRNLRSLKQVIDDFSQIFETLNETYQSNQSYITTLAKTFFALNIELKLSNINRHQIASGEVFQPTSKFKKKYFPLDQPVLKESFWVDALFNGDYSKLNELTSTLSLFTKPTTSEPDTLSQLSNFKILEDAKFEELVQKLETEIRSHEDELPGQFLRKSELLANFIENNLSNTSLSELSIDIKDHVEKYKNSEKWRTSDINYLSRYEVTFLSNTSELRDAYNYFLNTHTAAYNLAKNEKREKIASEKIDSFYDAVSNGNRTTLIELLIKEHPHTVFFTKIDPQLFVQALLEGSNEAMFEFIEIAAERYTMDRLREHRGSNELSLELDFWINTKTILESKISTAQALKAYNLRNLIDPTIINFCHMLSPI